MSPTEIQHALAPTGTLRASINLGNPVLAQGTADDPADPPRGVTVELARGLADELGVPLELLCFTAARDSVAAVTSGRADLGFFAVEPARAAEVAFTAPYTSIDGVYVVADTSAVAMPADVDGPGVRVGVKRGSAYDLYLTRTLRNAEIVRGDEGVDLFAEAGLEAGAGIRQPVAAWVGAHPGHRLVEPAFMQIQQALAIPLDRGAAPLAHLDDYVAARIADGTVAAALG